MGSRTPYKIALKRTPYKIKIVISSKYAARIRICVSVSEGYGYADTAISQKTRYVDTFYYFFNKINNNAN